MICLLCPVSEQLAGYAMNLASDGLATKSCNARKVNTLSHRRVLATVLRLAVAGIRTVRYMTPVVVVTMTLVAVVGCSESNRPSTTPATTTATAAPAPQPASDPAQWRLASDPAQLADDLVADEQALRDPSSSEAVPMAAARRQQAAYRAIGRHPEWDPHRPPANPAVAARSLRPQCRRASAAHRDEQGDAQGTLPAWRIDPPPADELLGYYREAESAPASAGLIWRRST